MTSRCIFFLRLYMTAVTDEQSEANENAFSHLHPAQDDGNLKLLSFADKFFTLSVLFFVFLKP